MAELTVPTAANYVFLPWVRQGVAAGIQTPDSRVIRLPQTNQKVREGVSVEHILNGTQNLRQRLSA